ncbi:MAG TPA: phage holin family protein [Thermomicrobiales bacterium]|nr:phage holin family protein [Thermomicrobiales bacterium]
MSRALEYFLGSVIINIVGLAILNWILDDFAIDTWWGLIGMALMLSLVPGIALGIAYRVARLIHPIVFPLFAFLFSALFVWIAPDLLDAIGIGGVHIHGWLTALWIALGVTFIGTVVAAIFSLNDEAGYDRFVTDQLRKNYDKTKIVSDKPALLFLEFDGLAIDVLQRAIRDGYMPTVKRWMDSGQHVLTSWEPDLSSQTSASQAGILLGSNHNIPAFRWWDKPRGQLMVSSSMHTADALEQELSSGDGLLVHDGGSRFNVFSGDAPDAMATFSKVSTSKLGKDASYLAYLANPYLLPRTFGLFLADCGREVIQGFQQRRKNELPRGHRRLKYVLTRATTSTVMLEGGRFVATADIQRGLPSAYYTFFSYDEIAHHSNVRSTDGLKILRVMDQMLEGLERAAQTAPRPVHLFLLSDHGQSQGATFKQRFGKTLDDVVVELIGEDANVTAILDSQEALGNISMAVTQAVKSDRRTSALAGRMLTRKSDDGNVHLGSYKKIDAAVETTAQVGATDAVVLASGNLGLISFPKFPHRMTVEEISEHFPRLIPGLMSHPGIAFVLANSSVDGGVVFGAEGVYYLDNDHIAGVNPLANFGPFAAEHLRRANKFDNAPDLYVNSMFDPVTEEVAAFEELVGNHGGLGGPQQRPFILHPAIYDAGPDPIVGAAHLSQIMKQWIDQAQGPFPTVQQTAPSIPAGAA